MAEKTFDLVRRVVEGVVGEAGYEVVEIQFPRYKSRQMVRVFIDKEGGVTLDDCKQVSRRIGEKLDIEDPFPARYTLEVSSPGVDRPLKTIGDFRRNIGHTLAIQVSDEGCEVQMYTGVLKDVQGERVILETPEEQIEIDIGTIVKGQVRALL